MYVETKTIKDICDEYGCSLKQWRECVDMLCSKGIANGVYQDYALLSVVVERLYQGSYEVEKEDNENE